MTNHAYTSFSLSYLNRARVLASTLRRQHPDWTLWAVVTDKPPDGFALDEILKHFDRLITAEELYGERAEQWLFEHDIVEACTAVKGRALVRLLDEPGCGKVFYFDPDIALFNSMEPVIELLEEYSIVLTPHQTVPEPRNARAAIRDNEIASLGFGAYNLGFIAVANGPEGRSFSRWWADRLDEWCHDNREIGLFVDQKWCDLVPCLFDRVKVLRDPGYNVASWNLSHRVMKYNEAGEALINGSPLRFYHFTKLGPIGDAMTLRYAGSNAEVYELWWWYRNQVQAATDQRIPVGWWYYGTFDNGEAIPKEAREIYRKRQDLRNNFSDPRKLSSGFYAWLVREKVIPLDPDPPR